MIVNLRRASARRPPVPLSLRDACNELPRLLRDVEGGRVQRPPVVDHRDDARRLQDAVLNLLRQLAKWFGVGQGG